MRTALLVVGSLLPIIAALTYIVSIFKGKSRPQRMTRFLLVVITAIMTTSLALNGDTSGVWLALASFLETLFIWVLSFKRGMGGSDALDWACLGLCGLGLVFWIVTDRPLVGLIASIVADCIAVLPSLRKTIRLPHTELAMFYALGSLAGLIILAAGPNRLEAMLFPAYIAVINAAFVLAIQWPRKQQVLSSEVEEA